MDRVGKLAIKKEKESVDEKYKQTLAEYKLLESRKSIQQSNEASRECQALEITVGSTPKNSTSENGILIMFYKKHIKK